MEHDKKKHSQPKLGGNRFKGGPEIWPHGYLISPIEISVNWPGSKQLWTNEYLFNYIIVTLWVPSVTRYAF